MGEVIEYHTPVCMVCGDTVTIMLDRDAYEKWRGGTFVQDAFPDMSPDERELLMTGTHPACWVQLFSD